jgi:hypothetical protein
MTGLFKDLVSPSPKVLRGDESLRVCPCCQQFQIGVFAGSLVSRPLHSLESTLRTVDTNDDPRTWRL